MLKEGDLIAVSEIKRIRNRQDGFTDVWLKGEMQSHIAHMGFGEMVDRIERCYQLIDNSAIDKHNELVKMHSADMEIFEDDTTKILPRPPLPKRHFPPLPGEE